MDFENNRNFRVTGGRLRRAVPCVGRRLHNRRSLDRDAPPDFIGCSPEEVHFLSRVADDEGRALLISEIGIMGLVHACIRFEAVFHYLVPRVDELKRFCTLVFICDLYWFLPTSSFIESFVSRFRPDHLHIGALEFMPMPVDLLLCIRQHVYSSLSFNLRHQLMPFLETSIQVDMLEIVQTSDPCARRVTQSILGSAVGVQRLRLYDGELDCIHLIHLWNFKLTVLNLTNIHVPVQYLSSYGRWVASQGSSLTRLTLDYRRSCSSLSAVHQLIETTCAKLPSLPLLRAFELTCGRDKMPFEHTEHWPPLHSLTLWVEVHSGSVFWESLKLLLVSPVATSKTIRFFCRCSSCIDEMDSLVAIIKRTHFSDVSDVRFRDHVHSFFDELDCP